MPRATISRESSGAPSSEAAASATSISVTVIAGSRKLSTVSRKSALSGLPS